MSRKITFQAAVVVVVWVSPLSQEWWFQFVSSSCIQPKNNVLTCIELQMNVMYNSMGAIYTVLLKGKIACESKARHKTSVFDDSSLAHSPTHISICLHHTRSVYATSRLYERLHVCQETHILKSLQAKTSTAELQSRCGQCIPEVKD